jgi:hypothetical protein
MSAVAGIDLGSLTVKAAADGRGVQTVPAPWGGPAKALRAGLLAAGGQGVICFAVPDSWLTGTAAGAAAQEAVRHECAGLLDNAQVMWAGQLAAAAAYTAAGNGPGRYLVCDVGGIGIRAGMFSGPADAVRVEAVHAEGDGGWSEFDAAVRVDLPQSPPLPAVWGEDAARHSQDRALRALNAALHGSARELAAPVYRISGPDGDVVLTAGRLIEAFTLTLERLDAAVAAVRGRIAPDYVVLTGGLSWLPLTGVAASVAAGAEPLLAGPHAAARGALLLAQGKAALAPPAERRPVAVPFNWIRDGLLEEVSVPLSWSEPFATFPGGPLTLDGEELALSVARDPKTARLRGLVPGPHLIGARPSWPGAGVLVVRPAAGSGPALIVPLGELTAR